MPTPTPVTVAEFREHLNKPTGASDDELQLMLEAATLAVEGWHKIGPMVVRSFIERATAECGLLFLPTTPAVALTTVTSVRTGTDYPVDGLDLDGVPGIVTAKGTWLPNGDYTVVYDAGRADVPEALMMATLIIGKHLWDTQRGPRTKLRGEDEESRAQWTGAGYLIPNRAAHLMQPYITVPVG